ncbi:MAG: T9SS type A sorting domain-containing protein [Bacteroidales bacterium]|jgi:hypothetical protein|nr:T9SS type A sorting domain-containing protein [Bacteroidales bacterium]
MSIIQNIYKVKILKMLSLWTGTIYTDALINNNNCYTYKPFTNEDIPGLPEEPIDTYGHFVCGDIQNANLINANSTLKSFNSNNTKLLNEKVIKNNEEYLQRNNSIVYPNPTKNKVYIIHQINAKKISLYSNTGICLETKYNNSQTTTYFYMSNYPAGTYYIQIDKDILQSFIKQ